MYININSFWSYKLNINYLPMFDSGKYRVSKVLYTSTPKYLSVNLFMYRRQIGWKLSY